MKTIIKVQGKWYNLIDMLGDLPNDKEVILLGKYREILKNSDLNLPDKITPSPQISNQIPNCLNHLAQF
jgi:hypothetical protein